MISCVDPHTGIADPNCTICNPGKAGHKPITPNARVVYVEYETKSRAGVTYKHYKEVKIPYSIK